MNKTINIDDNGVKKLSLDLKAIYSTNEIVGSVRCVYICSSWWLG